MEKQEKLIVWAVIDMLESTLWTMNFREADAIVLKATKILKSINE
jgi:hypothetical protein